MPLDVLLCIVLVRHSIQRTVLPPSHFSEMLVPIYPSMCHSTEECNITASLCYLGIFLTHTRILFVLERCIPSLV
jgi:hypothetical protein